MPRIFISYRREDTAPYAGRIYDGLCEHFSEAQIFMDLHIAPGEDFVERIHEEVGASDVLLAVIGRSWLTTKGRDDRPRLEDPDDFARIEIEAALERNTRIVPVLVGGAQMPVAEELPGSLAKLARRQAQEVSDSRWAYDMQQLIRAIDSASTTPPQKVERSAASPSTERSAGEGRLMTRGPGETGARRKLPQAFWKRPRNQRYVAAGGLTAVGLVVVLVLALSGGNGKESKTQKSESVPLGLPSRIKRDLGKCEPGTQSTLSDIDSTRVTEYLETDIHDNLDIFRESPKPIPQIRAGVNGLISIYREHPDALYPESYEYQGDSNLDSETIHEPTVRQLLAAVATYLTKGDFAYTGSDARLLVDAAGTCP
jgi:hypothetical protein